MDNKYPKNYYDLKGIEEGYLKDSVCFPFFDYDGNFKTAQIIKYGDNGKRIKEGPSTNWFHSYKPIRKKLGLDEKKKYKADLTHFFGEHLLMGSHNIVGIVEAPKTAVILKELYPNIDWIATAGESNLKSKNLDILEDRKVVLFPDAQTTQWEKIGLEYGFKVCNILDKHNAKEGSDLADYIFDSSFEGFNDINNYLFILNDGEFDWNYLNDNVASLKFNFREVGNNDDYFTAVPVNYRGKMFYYKKTIPMISI